MRSLFPTRLIRWVSLIPLVFFAAEWVVSATWRGLYGYRDDLLGPLGIAFCGPVGNWPCSDLYRALNVALVATGLAIVFVAAGFLAQRLTDGGSAALLLISGLALATSGAIPQSISYVWNLTATMVFMTLGSVSALLIAVNSVTKMSGERRSVAVVAGLAGLFGYFAYVGGHEVLGTGGTQRLCIYGILIVVVTVGTAGFVTKPAEDADTPELAGASR